MQRRGAGRTGARLELIAVAGSITGHSRSVELSDSTPLLTRPGAPKAASLLTTAAYGGHELSRGPVRACPVKDDDR